jgi:hypothetical protein
MGPSYERRMDLAQVNRRGNAEVSHWLRSRNMSTYEIVVGLDDSRSARAALRWDLIMPAVRAWCCAQCMR